MEVVSVNIGAAEQLDGKAFSGETGIFKRPLTDSIQVSELGLHNDAILHTKHHGGPDQAVYLYRQEDYDWWSTELGKTIAPGTFGDNLTLTGLPDANLPVGSRLTFAEIELEVSAPRIPCNILAERMGDARFAKQFIQAERPGLYCRVLRPGNIQAGEAFSLAQAASDTVSTLDMFRGAYSKLDRAMLERLLSAPIDIRSRTKYEAQLLKVKTARAPGA